MPNTLLFATNNEGRIYALSTSHSVWKEFQYLGLEFKKISAVNNFLWAIGGDRQVYVHVHGLDIPIRVKEEAYENERWFPIEGFANHLLPTDRPKFSSEDGCEARSIESIRLPSMAWQWEGDWKLECSLNGEPLDHDGWTYAIDFPTKYYAKKSWNSCVRRRKWVRYRRYSALNSWCAVAPLHKDPTQEPFIDAAIGGEALIEDSSSAFSVWAITAHGRVMFRTDVTKRSPEGQRWSAIRAPTGCEISQISVGSSGLVWAVLYNGRALVRTGIRRDLLVGDNWVEVGAPTDSMKIVQISVGTNSVWCVTNDHRVWFRRGIKGEISGFSADAATGNAWIEMVGNISHVSVAANDQVFAVGSEDRNIFFRSGVSPSDLTGKKWRQVQCPMQFSRASSTASLSSKRSGSESPTQNQRSLSSLFKEKAHVETSAIIETLPIEETCCSAPVTDHFYQKNNLWHRPTQSPPNSLTEKPSVSRYRVRISEHTASSAPVENVTEISGKFYDKSRRNPRAYSPLRSVGSVVGMEAHPESDSAVFETDSNWGSSVFGEEDDQSNVQYWTDTDSIWSCVSAGAVVVEPSQLPNWFKDSVCVEMTIELTQEWRLNLIDRLKNRLKGFEIDQTKYEKAIEISSWVKSGEAKVAEGGGGFADCLVELEWLTSASKSGSGTLTILNPDSVTMKLQLSLSEIVCAACCSEPNNPQLAIYTARRSALPIRLQFSSENELEDWLSDLSSSCFELNEVSGRPSDDSLWVTSAQGDVFNFDPVNLKAMQYNTSNGLYEQEVDLLAGETPYQTPLSNGMVAGSVLEITGCVFDDADHIRFDLQCHSSLKMKFIIEKMRHVAFHLNPRLNEKYIVMNAMENSEWSSNEFRSNDVFFAPGAEFKLIIRSDDTGFEVEVDGMKWPRFKHRLAPEAINGLFVSGRIKIYKVKYSSPKVIVALREMFWRQIGGHLRKVESSKSGVVWGIGYDNTAWYYTNGCGGSFMRGMSTNQTGINAMTDTHTYFIYENQRWNPLSGYTAHGLPTDRCMWSDASGKQKRSKESSKLISSHWQWISDWIVDFHTPGGVDRDGWQYAVDFSTSYHAKKNFTDYVRRRRWYRRCRLTTSGPWHEISNTKILDVSLCTQVTADETRIKIWAVATNGDVLFRRGVSQSCSSGTSWDHIVANQPLISISASPNNAVWAIGRNGSAYRRCQISVENVCGEAWQPVDPPKGSMLKKISAGNAGIWAIDSQNQLVVRKEVCSSFPEGSHWQVLQNIANDPPHEEEKIGFKSVTVTDEVWAVSVSGCLCKRSGVTAKNPAGTGWNLGVAANFNYIS